MEAPLYTDGNVTVMVRDVERAVEFYTATLGLRLKRRAPDGYVEVEGPGITIGLHRAVNIAPGTHGSMTVGLGVHDLDQAMAALADRGITFGRVVEEGPVRMAFFHDPDENTLYLVEARVREGRRVPAVAPAAQRAVAGLAPAP